LKTSFLKYLALSFLLAIMLESSHIPVISVFGQHISTSINGDDNSAEDPIKETESLRTESARDYLHQLTFFSFDEPVFLLPVNTNCVANDRVSYWHYAEVPTPPPSC
jgi:hypothetical protein